MKLYRIDDCEVLSDPAFPLRINDRVALQNAMTVHYNKVSCGSLKKDRACNRSLPAYKSALATDSDDQTSS